MVKFRDCNFFFWEYIVWNFIKVFCDGWVKIMVYFVVGFFWLGFVSLVLW